MKHLAPVQDSEISMSKLANLGTWQDEDLRGRLTWYRQVSDNQWPAKFRIARHVPVQDPLAEASEAALWRELEARTPEFLNLWNGIRDGACELSDEPKAQP